MLSSRQCRLPAATTEQVSRLFTRAGLAQYVPIFGYNQFIIPRMRGIYNDIWQRGHFFLPPMTTGTFLFVTRETSVCWSESNETYKLFRYVHQNNRIPMIHRTILQKLSIRRKNKDKHDGNICKPVPLSVNWQIIVILWRDFQWKRRWLYISTLSKTTT